MVLVLIVLLVTGAVLIFLYNTRFVESKDPITSAPATTKFLEAADERIAYSEVDNNSSTTVIFVGGLSAWNGTWQRVVDSVSAKKTDLNFIVVDLPPFGYSIPATETGYFRDAQAGRIASFIAEKNISKVILVGHSYGAGPVTEYAMRHPGSVEKLILIDAVLNIDETKASSGNSPAGFGPLRSLIIGALIHSDRFAISRLRSFVYITDHVDRPLVDVYTLYFDTKHVTRRFSAWLDGYLNDPLNYQSNSSLNYKNINFPVRLIWGDKDTITPIDGTKILLETVPNITLKTLNGVGHIPMIEDYIQFDNALLDALHD